MRSLVAVLAVFSFACGSNPSGTIDGGDDDGIDADGVPDDGMSSCPVGQWCVETSPVAGILLRDVWAVTTGDVFAVGDDGTILRRANNTWTAMESGTTENLLGVWAASSNDVWAVGQGGTILRYDGASWAPVGDFTIDIRAVWGAGPNDVFLVGPGTVIQWNGSTFVDRNLTGQPFSISGTSATDVWVTGEDSRVSHYTGTWETGIDPGAGNTYFAVEAIGDDVWVAAALPATLRTADAGDSWTSHAATGAVFQGGFHAVSATDIWAAGGSSVGHWDGASWTLEAPSAGAQFLGIHGAASYLWIVGADSLILHRN
jgi:hypothetical protein